MWITEKPDCRRMNKRDVTVIDTNSVQVKQRCPVLEEELTNLVVLAMERSEVDADGNNQLLWQHLSSQVIFFVLFQFTSFTDMVLGLYNKVGAQSFCCYTRMPGKPHHFFGGTKLKLFYLIPV